MGRDRWTKAACSFLVQCKGTGDPTIVGTVARWIGALGYRKVFLKTDGEPALVAVQEAIKRHARTRQCARILPAMTLKPTELQKGPWAK